MGPVVFPASGTASSLCVIKVGSSSLVEAGKLSVEKTDIVASMVRALFTRGFSALVVASGAIAIGRQDLAGAGNEDATRRQVLAAVGQGPHFQGIREAFARQGMSCAQFLLTPQDICDPPHSEPVRAALEHTLELGIVPVVNENDALSVRNNDVLAALLAARLGARRLLLLTDVDGVYDKNPHLHSDARRVDVVEVLTPALESAGSDAVAGLGTGGMAAKLGAAWIATRAGVPTVITRLSDTEVAVEACLGRHRGTLVAAAPPRPAESLRSLWCAFAEQPSGRVTCLPEGEGQLSRRLPITRLGVTSVDGTFVAGAVVDITDVEGRVIGRGRVRTGAKDVMDLNADELVLHSDEYVSLQEVNP